MSELTLAAFNMGFDGAQRHVEYLRTFTMGIAVGEIEHDSGAAIRAKLAHSFDDIHGYGGSTLLLTFFGYRWCQVTLPSFLARMVDKASICDLKEPGFDRGRFSQIISTVIGFDKRNLRQIIGQSLILG